MRAEALRQTGQTAASEHHHDMRGRGFLGQILGVPGEMHSGIIDHPFVNGCRDHR